MVLGAVVLLVASSLCGVASADEDWALVVDDPLVLPQPWLDARRPAQPADDIRIVQDELLEPWEKPRRAKKARTRDDRQLDCDCDRICSDVLTPREWR